MWKYSNLRKSHYIQVPKVVKNNTLGLKVRIHNNLTKLFCLFKSKIHNISNNFQSKTRKSPFLRKRLQTYKIKELPITDQKRQSQQLPLTGSKINLI